VHKLCHDSPAGATAELIRVSPLLLLLLLLLLLWVQVQAWC
jgi:hypothetical protein